MKAEPESSLTCSWSVNREQSDIFRGLSPSSSSQFEGSDVLSFEGLCFTQRRENSAVTLVLGVYSFHFYSLLFGRCYFLKDELRQQLAKKKGDGMSY